MINQPENEKPFEMPPETDEEQQELQTLAEQAFLRTLQVFLNLSNDKHRAMTATAQGLASLIGVVFANKGHLKCAADICTVISDNVRMSAALPEDHRQLLLKRMFDKLNEESGTGKKILLS